MKRLLTIFALAVVILAGGATMDAKTAPRKKSTRAKTTQSQAKPLNMAGCAYQGEGNGGGMPIETTIIFQDNGKCEVSSNYHYGAMVEPITVQSTYRVSGRNVTINIPLPDDEPLTWKFKVSADGEKMSYDNSDRSMGNMGLDYQTLLCVSECLPR